MVEYCVGGYAMLTEERHTIIVDMVNKRGIVKTQELMQALNCSESTIRRDLETLHNDGKIKRIHGGAKRIYQISEELTVREKSLKNVQEKSSIGKMAASLIEENDVIFLDAGTTTLAMIDFINKGNITVVTNGIQQASLLTDKQIETILIGGRIKQGTKAIVGSTSFTNLQSFRFNKAFLGVNGIDIEFGLTTPDPEEATIKKLAQQQSSMTYVLADHTKWKKVNFVHLFDMEDVTIITNNSKEDLSLFKEKTTILEAE